MTGVDELNPLDRRILSGRIATELRSPGRSAVARVQDGAGIAGDPSDLRRYEKHIIQLEILGVVHRLPDTLVGCALCCRAASHHDLTHDRRPPQLIESHHSLLVASPSTVCCSRAATPALSCASALRASRSY